MNPLELLALDKEELMGIIYYLAGYASSENVSSDDLIYQAYKSTSEAWKCMKSKKI